MPSGCAEGHLYLYRLLTNLKSILKGSDSELLGFWIMPIIRCSEQNTSSYTCNSSTSPVMFTTAVHVFWNETPADKVTAIPEEGQADPKGGSTNMLLRNVVIYHSKRRHIPEDLNLLPPLPHLQLICTAAGTVAT
jgi:hypothetical protein